MEAVKVIQAVWKGELTAYILSFTVTNESLK